MIRTMKTAQITVALALLAGFAFVVPPASAVEDETDTPTVTTTATIPPCAATPEPSAGPATVGLDDFCNPWAEIETDAADCRAETDRPDAHVDCDTPVATTTNCFYIYWKKEVGPIVWEQRSSCDGEIYVNDDWQA